ncbi:MAG: DUF2934 domain-containing protein [Gammaproteobacteria bacterium]|nr:DUF2934 domain-containing protein [Gammaproteobacteria bacterium]
MPKGKSKKPARAHKATLRELAEAEITPEEREEMIAETAYYRALARSFEGDEHLRDWFEAEKIVDEMLRKASTKQADITH